MLNQRVRPERICSVYLGQGERGALFSGSAQSARQLLYVEQGTLHAVVDGKAMLLHPGELLLLPPESFFVYYADIECAPRYLHISFRMDAAPELKLPEGLCGISPRTAATLEAMMREQAREEDYAEEMLYALLSQLLIFLIREDPVQAAVVRSGGESEIIRRAQQYIRGHACQRLSVPQTARMIHVSPSYMTALFQKHLGISPGEYIRRVKLQESKRMILEGSMTFTQIAAALEYSTVHHFSRQFKEKFGITPTEYARSSKQKG